MKDFILLAKDTNITIEKLQNLKVVKSGLIKIEDNGDCFKCTSSVSDVMAFYRFGAETIQAHVMNMLGDIKEEIKK